MIDEPEMCCCGKPLHYTDPDNRRLMEELIKTIGPTVPMHAGGETYLVPRHYIAIHGIKAWELPVLAKKYRWRKL